MLTKKPMKAGINWKNFMRRRASYMRSSRVLGNVRSPYLPQSPADSVQTAATVGVAEHAKYRPHRRSADVPASPRWVVGGRPLPKQPVGAGDFARRRRGARQARARASKR